MEDFIKLMSEALASNKKKLSFKHTSVFTALTVGAESNQQIIASQIATGTINSVNIIKNKIVPYVKDYKKLVTAKIDSIKPVSILDSYKVVEFKTPGVIKELINESVIVPTTEPIELPITTLVIPAPEDITNYIKFNSGITNTYLKEHVAKFTNDELVGIWNTYLGNVSSSNNTLMNLNLRPIDNVDKIIVLLAMVNTIKTEKQPGVRLSDGNYMQVMSILDNYLGNLLASLDNDIELRSKYDKLVLGYDKTTLIVNGLIYDNYLENGTVEGLLGYLVSGDVSKNVTTAELLANQDDYLKTWNNAIAREQYRLLSAAPNNYKLAYELALGELYANMSEDALNNLVAVSEVDAKSLAIKMMENITVNSSSDKLTDVDYITRLIMGDIVFNGTLLKEYLYSIVQNHKTTPSLGMEELATMATIELIITYLMEQVVIEEI